MLLNSFFLLFCIALFSVLLFSSLKKFFTQGVILHNKHLINNSLIHKLLIHKYINVREYWKPKKDIPEKLTTQDTQKDKTKTQHTLPDTTILNKHKYQAFKTISICKVLKRTVSFNVFTTSIDYMWHLWTI